MIVGARYYEVEEGSTEDMYYFMRFRPKNGYEPGTLIIESTMQEAHDHAKRLGFVWANMSD